MTEPKCINLKERFGDRWRIEYEPSYYADRGQRTRTADPWLMIIPCQHGHICPWGGDLLAACTNNLGPIATRLARLPSTRLVQDADDGVNATFQVDRIDEVAQIMRPRRRRPRQTEAQHRAAVENLARGKAYQFTAKNRPQRDLESPAGHRKVSEHVRASERPF